REAPRSAGTLVQVLSDQTGILTYSDCTYKRWLRVDGTHAYGYVEVHDEATGNLLIDLTHRRVLDDSPLAAEWRHDSLPGLRDLATEVTNPDHPNLTLYYHHEHRLVCVHDPCMTSCSHATAGHNSIPPTHSQP
ncbi:MAG: hypothetical protein ACKPKO_12060, partial [Candidatus Fonsibacter sp.]